MKVWNECICLTSRKTLMILATLLISTLVLASVWPGEVVEVIEEGSEEEPELWIPTEDDIAYQDSMYTIIKSTQNDVTDIKEDIVLILERLDYVDGTWDSIRYVKGSEIDKRRN